jgi:hypothetical protein
MNHEETLRKIIIGFDLFCGISTPDFDDYVDGVREKIGLPYPQPDDPKYKEEAIKYWRNAASYEFGDDTPTEKREE